MTEQERREKVIKGLECCVRHFGDCEGCPYDEGSRNCGCGKQLYADALTLLKSQEPRVMTLEEIDTAPAGYVVLQTRDMRDMLEWYDGLLFSVNVNWTVDIITIEGKKRLQKDDYDKTWRCWTSRPTDEQREATAWSS